MSSSRWTLSPESVTAVAAIITSVVALAFGIWQTVETRHHNRLSVRPLLTVQTSYRLAIDPDEAQAFNLSALERAPLDTLRATIEVTNKGLGLADVTDMRIAVETLAGGTEPFDSWEDARPALEAFGVRLLSNATLGGGSKIEPGESLTVLALDGIGTGSLDSLDAVMDRIDIDIDYRSLYEEPFTTHEHDDEP